MKYEETSEEFRKLVPKGQFILVVMQHGCQKAGIGTDGIPYIIDRDGYFWIKEDPNGFDCIGESV